jgi:hypothetical protein
MRPEIAPPRPPGHGLAFPDYAALQDALTGGPTRAGAELLSFLDQAAFADRFRAKVDTAPELLTRSDVRFRWDGYASGC